MGGSHSQRRNSEPQFHQPIAPMPPYQPPAPHSHPRTPGILDRTPTPLAIRHTKTKRNPCAILLHTLKLKESNQANNRYSIYFKYNAEVASAIHIDLFCEEKYLSDSRIPTYVATKVKLNPSHVGKIGMGVEFESSEEYIDFGKVSLRDFMHNQRSNIYPIVIQMRSKSVDGKVKCEYTLAELLPISNNSQRVETDMSDIHRRWTIHVLKQYFQDGNDCFEVQQLYGVTRGDTRSDGNQNSADTLATGRECVICLTNQRTTAVLPCLHMCLCNACANIMRIQSEKCPMCRQSVESLMELVRDDTVEADAT